MFITCVSEVSWGQLAIGYDNWGSLLHMALIFQQAHPGNSHANGKRTSPISPVLFKPLFASYFLTSYGPRAAVC